MYSLLTISLFAGGIGCIYLGFLYGQIVCQVLSILPELQGIICFESGLGQILLGVTANMGFHSKMKVLIVVHSYRGRHSTLILSPPRFCFRTHIHKWLHIGNSLPHCHAWSCCFNRIRMDNRIHPAWLSCRWRYSHPFQNQSQVNLYASKVIDPSALKGLRFMILEKEILFSNLALFGPITFITSYSLAQSINPDIAYYVIAFSNALG